MLMIYSHAFVLVLILRLRQMCIHPSLILVCTCHLFLCTPFHRAYSVLCWRQKAGADELDDPTTMMSDTVQQKELLRAVKAMGGPWVSDVRFPTTNHYELHPNNSEPSPAQETVCKGFYLMGRERCSFEALAFWNAQGRMSFSISMMQRRRLHWRAPCVRTVSRPTRPSSGPSEIHVD